MKFVKVWPININIRINKSILNGPNEGEIGQAWTKEVIANILFLSSLMLLFWSSYRIHVARWNQ